MKKVLLILGELDDNDINWIVENSNRDEISEGTILIHEGQPISTLYILLEGELKVSTTALGDREIASLSSGEVVGEMSFVDTRPPSATVTAKQNSLVVTIPRDKLAAKLQQDLGFASRFYRALAMFLSNRLRMTVDQLSSGTDTHITATEVPEEEATRVAQSRLDSLLQRLKEG
jgi:CRP-like cAMP-binding protein